MSVLRQYQVECLNTVRQCLRDGKRAPLVVIPTGGGKTRIGVEAAIGHVNKDGRTLWLAHRDELVEQAAGTLIREGVPESDVGLMTAGIPQNTRAPIQVASIATLVARKVRPKASLVVFDEAHHYVASEWGSVANDYRDSWKLGLTATPERGDGKPLGDLFDCIVDPVNHAQLIKLGYLVPCDVYNPQAHLKDATAGDPLTQYLGLARSNELTFWFCRGVAEAEERAAQLNQARIPALAVSGTTPWFQRREAVEKFRRREVQVLVNVYIFTEGTDIPEASCCVLERNMGHVGMYLQSVGRVLRPAEGKSRAIVIDLVGVSRQPGFGHPTADRVYSLDGTPIQLDGSKPHRKRGSKIAPPKDALAVVDVPLALATEDELERVAKQMCRCDVHGASEFLQKMMFVAKRDRRGKNWAIAAFVRRYGHLPWTKNEI